ncbi:MAG: CRTAC1 family protein, partial [Gemmatimonadota bacterium]|nr:CRTAC1 family protein [Gemmatimonadota bacterium]
VFTDVDRDGDPDLALATEWGPVRLLRNDEGRLVDATEAWGLAGLTGRWNAVAAGDFDADGRPDLVATSWGENTGVRASPERPLEVYYGDVDRNGTFEVIQARYDPRIGAPAPLASYGRLGRALPALPDRVPSHRAYADASVEDVLGGRPAGRLEAVTTAHTVFLNRGDRFEARPLPPEAQWAPSFGVAVADADGDGAEDVFLAQNFFATDEESPRHDAGRGGWLRGDGEGGFSWVPARISGVAAYGDQRGVAVADVDGDARADLVLGQNGGEARLFRNRGARPGLRVRLVGPSANRFAIGASVRLVYGDTAGPIREIRAGSGAGSHDDPVPVLGIADPEALTAVEVRWPGGRVQRVAVTAEQREVTVRAVAPGEGSP